MVESNEIADAFDGSCFLEESGEITSDDIVRLKTTQSSTLTTRIAYYRRTCIIQLLVRRADSAVKSRSCSEEAKKTSATVLATSTSSSSSSPRDVRFLFLRSLSSSSFHLLLHPLLSFLLQRLFFLFFSLSFSLSKRSFDVFLSRHPGVEVPHSTCIFSGRRRRYS